MTTSKKANPLFLSIILSDHPLCLYYAGDRFLYLDTNIYVHQSLAMDEKPKHIKDLMERLSHSGFADST